MKIEGMNGDRGDRGDEWRWRAGVDLS